MNQNQASKQSNKGTVYFDLYGDLNVSKSKPKFKIRILEYKLLGK